MYLNGEIVKTQLQEMKNEQNRNQASEEIEDEIIEEKTKIEKPAIKEKKELITKKISKRNNSIYDLYNS